MISSPRRPARSTYTKLRHLRFAATDVRPLLRRRLGIAGGFVRWLVIGGAALAALLAFGIDLQGLWATTVTVLSLVAIGFVAVWSLLSHMLAAVLIVVFRPFEFGERLEIVGDDPIRGEVVDLNPVYTTLRADDGDTLQIPNNLFFQKVTKRGASVAATTANGHARGIGEDTP